MKKDQAGQIFQKMEERIRDTVAAIENNELYLLSVNTREIKLDILFNRVAISISLEKGDVNQIIEFAKRLRQEFPNHHVVVYLSTRRSDRQDRIAYDAKPMRHRIYPRMTPPYGNNKFHIS